MDSGKPHLICSIYTHNASWIFAKHVSRKTAAIGCSLGLSRLWTPPRDAQQQFLPPRLAKPTQYPGLFVPMVNTICKLYKQGRLVPHTAWSWLFSKQATSRLDRTCREGSCSVTTRCGSEYRIRKRRTEEVKRAHLLSKPAAWWQDEPWKCAPFLCKIQRHTLHCPDVSGTFYIIGTSMRCCSSQNKPHWPCYFWRYLSLSVKYANIRIYTVYIIQYTVSSEF